MDLDKWIECIESSIAEYNNAYEARNDVVEKDITIRFLHSIAFIVGGHKSNSLSNNINL